MSPAVSDREIMRHFIEELDRLTNKLLEMSSLVESAIYHSVTAVVQKDEALAREASLYAAAHGRGQQLRAYYSKAASDSPPPPSGGGWVGAPRARVGRGR